VVPVRASAPGGAPLNDRSSPAVRASALCVEAGGRRILGPVDLELPPGEYVALQGPSGSGKSTLLRAIAGLSVPSAGTLDLFGERASEPGHLRIAPERRGVGMMFQGGALWPHMSVRRTLAFALRSARTPRSAVDARIAELVAWAELEGLEDRMPGTLSGGEAQRLALARALAPKPRVLLFDEPLGKLDAELRSALLERLRSLHDELGFTALHVTHDPDEASRVAGRTLRMEGGRLEGADR